MNAADLATPVTAAMIPAMKGAGIEAVCRYLSNSPAKNLSFAEARLLSDAGINCVLVWEARGDRYDNFTWPQGAVDVTRALAQASALGVPQGAAIYYAFDFDISDTQINIGGTAYMRAVRAAMATSGFRTGVYGNGGVCNSMLSLGLADLAWVWGAGGTNGTADFVASNRWAIRQHPTVREFGTSVDPDDVQGDYGGFRIGGSPITVTAADAVATVRLLQGQLAALGYYQGQIDGQDGPLTSAAAMRAFREAPND